MNSDEDVIASLCELHAHKKYILSLFETEIKTLEHHCWRYKEESYFHKLSEAKKVYNILKYLLQTYDEKRSTNK